MLVYGDHCEHVDPPERLEALSKALSQVARLPPGIDRHGKLVGALVDAGQLLQGIADEGGPTFPLDQFVYRIAGCVVRSWDSRFAEVGQLPPVPQIERSATLEVRIPEGFAFYSVYPEAYVEAARRLTLSAPARVIGIRSIGTTLGSVVAVALGAPPPMTLRPVGDPFARQVQLPSDDLDLRAHYVIVDEGPGVSGSSFGSVADALEHHGIPLDRIAFVPSHDGDLGPNASESHRERWHGAQRVAAEFDCTWLSERVGPLNEIIGCDPFERRKFLGWRSGERVLVKFAGLGRIGERKLELARTLHAEGFTPEPLDFLHGFLVERWEEDAQPLRSGEKPLKEIGRYLGARAKLLPARATSGASIEDLRVMCRRNISLALGERACDALSRFSTNLLQRRVRRKCTDNKLDRPEWLRLPNGRLLKTDAVDHHQAHDLIGCQDICWDIAGAIIEFDLTDEESSILASATGCEVDPQLLDFCLIAYASFRLARAVVANGAAEAERYRNALQLLLQGCDAKFPRESLVG